MLILDEAAAREGLNEVGRLQQRIESGAGNLEQMGAELAELVDDVLRFLIATGHVGSSVYEQLVAPLSQWNINLSSHFLDDNDPRAEAYRSVFDSVRITLQQYYYLNPEG